MWVAAALALLGAGFALRLTIGRPDPSARAEEIYTRRCAYCHDVEGAIGVALDRRVLATYGDAHRLFDYVRLAMPYDAPRTMSDEELWLAVAHLLRSRGLAAADARLERADAAEIRLR